MTNQAPPLISLVTPSYNQGRFIRETIESVLSQSYRDIEYWVIDGGSTDETVAVCRSFESDARFHWISEPDRGQSDAINKGIARCSGDLFNWLGADDVLTPNALAGIVTNWRADRPAIIYGLSRFIDAIGNDLGFPGLQAAQITYEDLLFQRLSPIQPSAFLPLPLVKSLGGVDSRLHFSMDHDLFLRLAEQVNLVHVPRVLSLYRLHPDSKTVANVAKFADDLIAICDKAQQRGRITLTQSAALKHLLAARKYLMPEVRQTSRGLRALWSAARTDRFVWRDCLRVFAQFLGRRLLGPKIWSMLRAARAQQGVDAPTAHSASQ
jgi:glycosyltransferase involved in cell wall biosynthesis